MRRLIIAMLLLFKVSLWVIGLAAFMSLIACERNGTVVKENTYQFNPVYDISDKAAVIQAILDWRSEHEGESPVYKPIYAFKFSEIDAAQSLKKELFEEHNIESQIIKDPSGERVLACYP